MRKLLMVVGVGAALSMLWRWYQREVLTEAEGIVRLQSEHEHFHLHVDLPPSMAIEPGDTVHILRMPQLPDGRTEGELVYHSPVQLYKASWLKRSLIKRSSLIEVNELVEHP